MLTTDREVPVLGMTCAACVRRVERAVAAVPGVASVEVNLAMSTARFVLDDPAAEGAAIAAVRHAGYQVPDDLGDGTGDAPADATVLEHAEAEEQRGLRRDAVVAIALTAPLLVLAMAMVPGRVALLAQVVLGTAVLAIPGRRFFRLAIAAVRHGTADMNVLVALGAGSAWTWSMVTTIGSLGATHQHGGMPHVYFEAAGAIIMFLTIGKLLEARARGQVSAAVRALASVAPDTAMRRAADGAVAEVAASALRPGDVVLVRPGTRAPADGTVIEGASAVDESLLTGESAAVDKEAGSALWSGTLNHTGALTMRVARAGATTAMARIGHAVEQAQRGKADVARLADRISAVFAPAVLVIAAITFGIWILIDSPEAAALRAVAVLVIACPCALGLATPAAVAVGTARAAQLGVLFKGGAVVERVARLDAVLLDKTGTLTAGKPVLVGIDLLGSLDEARALTLAAAVEQHSEHPLARGIGAAARARSLVLPVATDVVAEPGGGIHGVVAGSRVDLRRAATTAGDATAIELKVDDVAVARLRLRDEPSPTAAATITALRALGLRPVMVTGDRAEVAHAVAAAVGIAAADVHADVRPAGKAALVAAERGARNAHVAMVGDGINDAPALAAADVGIALGTGTDAAIAAADVTILRGGIAAVPTAIALARATLHTVHRNLALAFLYNVAAIPLAAGALAPFTSWRLSPMLASAAMSLSSVSVLLSSLHLRRWTPPGEKR